MNKRLALIAAGGILASILFFTLAAMVKPDLQTLLPGFTWNSAAPWSGDWSTAFDCDDEDSGPEASTELPWTTTDSLAISLPGKVEFTPASSTRVTIKGPANLIHQVRLHEGRLELDRKLHGACASELVVSISAPAVTHWSLFGVGKLRLHQLDQADLDLKLFGTGKIEADGKVEHIGINITGTGRAAMNDLHASDADVVIIGTGRADVRATQRADISITGPGRVTLYGQPQQLDSNVIGPGRIRQAGAESSNDAEDEEDETTV